MRLPDNRFFMYTYTLFQDIKVMLRTQRVEYVELFLKNKNIQQLKMK